MVIDVLVAAEFLFQAGLSEEKRELASTFVHHRMLPVEMVARRISSGDASRLKRYDRWAHVRPHPLAASRGADPLRSTTNTSPSATSSSNSNHRPRASDAVTRGRASVNFLRLSLLEPRRGHAARRPQAALCARRGA